MQQQLCGLVLLLSVLLPAVAASASGYPESTAVEVEQPSTGVHSDVLIGQLVVSWLLPDDPSSLRADPHRIVEYRDVRVLDMSLRPMTWFRTTHTPTQYPSARRYACVVALNSTHVALVGGQLRSGQLVGSGSDDEPLIWLFDTQTLTWSAVPLSDSEDDDQLQPRHSPVCVADPLGNLVVYGGIDAAGTSLRHHSIVWFADANGPNDEASAFVGVDTYLLADDAAVPPPHPASHRPFVYLRRPTDPNKAELVLFPQDPTQSDSLDSFWVLRLRHASQQHWKHVQTSGPAPKQGPGYLLRADASRPDQVMFIDPARRGDLIMMRQRVAAIDLTAATWSMRRVEGELIGWGRGDRGAPLHAIPAFELLADAQWTTALIGGACMLLFMLFACFFSSFRANAQENCRPAINPGLATAMHQSRYQHHPKQD